MSRIKSFGVSKGVYYIEFPGTDLKVLCGVPSDCVKHLIQREFIRNEIKNGITCETGPNAILLSDIPIQNGQLSNLSEFPFLQMLYRQGMIVPGHPNKTDKYPIMIGSATQIISQMEYIYLGNYGIDNVNELMRNGLSHEDATELLRLKKKFAFGRFISSQELIHQRVVNNEFIEIIDGVFIRRLSINIFEFKYGDERTIVDLNLAWDEYYEAPYDLPNLHFKRNVFSVIHSGQGNGWDMARPCMSSILSHKNKLYLIDTIPNVDLVIKALGISINEVDGIFITHVHDDHFNGITALMKANHTINIYATPLIQYVLLKKLCVLLAFREKDLRNIFNFVNLTPNEWNEVEGIKVKPAFSPHPVETYNMHFSYRTKEGDKTYAHMADIASLTLLNNYVEADITKPGISKELFERIQKEYLAPADLKKIDAGGGDIHGNPYDFQHDKSKKIIFAHTTQPLFEKNLLAFGCNTEFGAVDVFEESDVDLNKLEAKRILEIYFNQIDPEVILPLLDNPIVKIEPYQTIIQFDKEIDFLYLIITGIVVGHWETSSIPSHYSIGSLIGEDSIYENSTTALDYTTETYVDALKIPVNVLKEFINKHQLSDFIKEKAELRNVINTSKLFSTNDIPTYQLNKFADSIKTEWIYQKDFVKKSFDNYIYDLNLANHIFIILEGEINLSVHNRIGNKFLGKGDCFGENIIYGLDPFFYYKLRSDCRIAIVECTKIIKIPCVFESLYEVFEKNLFYVARELQKNSYYIPYDQNKHICYIQTLNNASVKMLFAYNYFEFLYRNDSLPNMLESSAKNLLMLFCYYSEVKKHHLKLISMDESAIIISNLENLEKLLSNIYKKIKLKQKSLAKDISEIRQAIIKSLSENYKIVKEST